MSTSLSEVTVLFGQRAGDIEKAREIFTGETRAFVAGILAALQRIRSEPWTSGRVRTDLPKEIETESKATGYLSNQYALGRVQVRFKKQTKFVVVGEVKLGIEYDPETEGFAWQVALVPASRYQQIDDLAWREWRGHARSADLPGGMHQERANTVRFVSRGLSPELTGEVAYNDVKTVLDFVLGADAALAEAIGVDLTPEEEAAGD